MSSQSQQPENFSAARKWLRRVSYRQEMDRGIAPYVDAAAVLSTFSVESLRPIEGAPQFSRDEVMLALAARARKIEEGRWQLTERVRREALQRLKSREQMRRAREANPDISAADSVQKAMDLLIFQESPPQLDDFDLDGLAGLDRAVRWLGETLPNLPSLEELAARIERESQLAPMRKLAGEHFVDRKQILDQLTDYVGALQAETALRSLWRGINYVRYKFDERPPLHLHGAGGVGKSAILSRFILNHAAPQMRQPLPFIYLDFDRVALDPRQPDTILIEAIRQVLAQFPVAGEMANLEAQATELTGSMDFAEFARSSHSDLREHLMRRFANLLSRVAERNDQPVLMALDTLEEAEAQGTTAIEVTWRLLRDLMSRVDRLRIVTAGRGPLPPGTVCEPVPVEGLPKDAARELVGKVAQSAGMKISTTDIDAIVSLVGTVPLSLKLALRVVLKEGVQGLEEALKDPTRRQGLFARIKAEQQQGLLYRRILSHLEKRDERVKRIANPGLILRRVTSEIIEKVLAGPCDLKLRNSAEASELFAVLSNEAGLVDSAREPDALWHLTSVRQVMLSDLRSTLGPLAREIDFAAIEYYRSRPNPSPVERSEYIYHSLWVDFDGKELAALWNKDVEHHLASAFEELKPNGKIWMAKQMGRELSAELRAKADYADWEIHTHKRAVTLLSSGYLDAALDALRERPRPAGQPSPLYALEVDALKLLGRGDEAITLARTGVQVSESCGHVGEALALLVKESTLLEARADLQEAFEQARHAVELALRVGDPLDGLNAAVTALRIGRKIEIDAADETAFREQARMWLANSMVWKTLPTRPTLLREAAAELGSEFPELLVILFSQVGISPEDRIALLRQVEDTKPALSSIEARAFSILLESSTARGLGDQVSVLAPRFAKFLSERLREGVEESLGQRTGRATETQDLHLNRKQSEAVSEAIARSFKQEEFITLTTDILDISAGLLTGNAQHVARTVLKLASERRLLQKLIFGLSKSSQQFKTEVDKFLKY